jgi:hypothetical protein
MDPAAAHRQVYSLPQKLRWRHYILCCLPRRIPLLIAQVRHELVSRIAKVVRLSAQVGRLLLISLIDQGRVLRYI